VPLQLKVDPGVVEQITADHIPSQVKRAVAAELEAFANNPLMGIVQDPVAGPCHMFEFMHEEFLWRFAFNVVLDEDRQPIGIGAVAINPP
jgi:hypothetical protein